MVDLGHKAEFSQILVEHLCTRMIFRVDRLSLHRDVSDRKSGVPKLSRYGSITKARNLGQALRDSVLFLHFDLLR